MRGGKSGSCLRAGAAAPPDEPEQRRHGRDRDGREGEIVACGRRDERREG
jgi:hypothetical protein